MPTIESAEDITLHAKIALHVKFFDARILYTSDIGFASVYQATDPVWLDHSQLGSINDIVYRCHEFRTTRNDPDAASCLVLSDRVSARPPMPITDEACPVMMILWTLQARGWKYKMGTCTHCLTNVDRKVCDGRNTMRSKLYYMVLTRLSEMVKLTSSIPSGQSQLFYRLLLAGKRTEPNLSTDEYLALCGGKANLVPLPAPEEGVDVGVAPPPLLDDDEDLVLGVPGSPNRGRKRAKPSDNLLPRAEPSPKAARRKTEAKAPPPPLPPVADPPGPPPVAVAPPVGAGSRPGSSGDPGGGGGGEPGPPEPGVDTDSDDDLVFAGPVAAPQPKAARRPQNKRDAIGGGWVKFDSYVLRGKRYPNYTISCLTCPSKKCQKTLGATPDNCKIFGRIEVLAFLHAWRSTPITDPSKTRARHNPDNAAVVAYVEAHRAELERLVDECVAPGAA